jgi:hypothetical protein
MKPITESVIVVVLNMTWMRGLVPSSPGSTQMSSNRSTAAAVSSSMPFWILSKIIQFSRNQPGRVEPRILQPAHQLMVLLKYLGTEDSGASDSDLCNLFGIGKGTAQLYQERVVKAI